MERSRALVWSLIAHVIVISQQSFPRSIVVDSQFFGLKDGSGGVEALVQLSIALKHATLHNSAVYLSLPVDYANKWMLSYGNDLVLESMPRTSLESGDLYITSEIVPCPRDLKSGVHLFIFFLAEYSGGCRKFGARFLSHNQFLANYSLHGQQLRLLPPERIIQPYITPSIVNFAHAHAGLLADGVISFLRRDNEVTKDDVVLIDDDVPIAVVQIIKAAAARAGGSAVTLANFSSIELLQLYRKAKIVVDWCMVGMERGVLEASLFGAVLITNDCSTGSSFADIPIPSQFLIRRGLGNGKLPKRLFNLFHEVFHNYWAHVGRFEPLRRSILGRTAHTMALEARRFLESLHVEGSAMMGGGCVGC